MLGVEAESRVVMRRLNACARSATSPAAEAAPARCHCRPIFADAEVQP
jgi:hypothetical protein